MPDNAFDARAYLEDWTQAWRDRDPARLMSYVADDVTFRDSMSDEPRRGRDAYRDVLANYFQAFKVRDLEGRIVVQQEDRVGYLLRIEMQHTDPLSLPDGTTVDPTGETITFDLADFLMIDDQGRIVEDVAVYDVARLLRGIGVTEVPATTA